MTCRCLAGVALAGTGRAGADLGSRLVKERSRGQNLPCPFRASLALIFPPSNHWLREGAEGETSSFALSYFCLATFFQQSSF